MSAVADTIFYDGDCGFCHRTVLFLLKHDPDGTAFRYAPLGGSTFEKLVPPLARAELPDSLVLWTEDERLLLRSDATAHTFRRLGGAWAWLAGAITLLPRALRDPLYDAFARIRHRLFARPDGACPIVPAELRARFDD